MANNKFKAGDVLIAIKADYVLQYKIGDRFLVSRFDALSDKYDIKSYSVGNEFNGITRDLIERNFDFADKYSVNERGDIIKSKGMSPLVYIAGIAVLAYLFLFKKGE